MEHLRRWESLVPSRSCTLALWLNSTRYVHFSAALHCFGFLCLYNWILSTYYIDNIIGSVFEQALLWKTDFCRSFCPTVLPTNTPSTKNENFHIPKWAGFFWYCTQIRHSNFAQLPTLDLKLIIIVMLLQLLVCSNDWLLSTMATMLATAATFFWLINLLVVGHKTSKVTYWIWQRTF